MTWSVDARLMVSPFRTYLELSRVDAAHEHRAWLLVRRPLLWLFVIGALVSFSTSGRWVWFHVLSSLVMWAFVPLYQIFWMLLIVRVSRKSRPIAELVDLFFAGQGPWLLFFCVLSGICIFVPGVWPTFSWLMSNRILHAVLILTIAWSAILTFAFFRSALDMKPCGAFLATLAFYVTFDGTIIAYYVATDQLTPLLFGAA